MELHWLLIDDNGDAITGGAASTSLKLIREADNYFFDWADSVFKNVGWTTIATTLSEVSATNAAGLYEKIVSEATFADGWYLFLGRYVSGSTKRNSYTRVYVKSGQEMEKLILDQVAKFQFDVNNFVKSTHAYRTGAVVADAANGAAIFKTNLTEAVDDYWKECWLQFTSGALNGQARKIISYNSATKQIFTFSVFAGVPAPGDTFKLINE